jgi:superfamily II DNA or RNA helicase
VLPEVVYAYGLKEAIDKGFLKKETLHGYANTAPTSLSTLPSRPS